jgi:uncharacterized protein YecT (DUF1311 family)
MQLTATSCPRLMCPRLMSPRLESPRLKRSPVKSAILAFAAICLMVAAAFLPNGAAQESQVPASQYDKAIFHDPIPSDQLAFLNHFAGLPSKDLVRDKQYRKLMHSVILDCTFHYGRDMALADALEMVLTGSSLPVEIYENRYVIVSGRSGPYLRGRGFMWIDTQDGIALGGFYFHPTNGEPTPTVTIFSKQVKEESLKMSQLPAAFAVELSRWSAESGISRVTTRYFIGGVDRKILLEHDEDACSPADGTTAPADCEQINAEAADIDLDAAYYLEQTDHATNATAWMISGPDQVAWIQVRDDTCRVAPDRLRCRIRVTRERTHVIINQNRHSVAQLPHK